MVGKQISFVITKIMFKVFIIFRRSLHNHNKNDSYNTNGKVPIIFMSSCTKIDQSLPLNNTFTWNVKLLLKNKTKQEIVVLRNLTFGFFKEGRVGGDEGGGCED